MHINHSLVRRFWSLWAHRHWRYYALGLVFMAVVSATSVAYLFLIQWTYDRFEARDTGILWVIPLVLAVTAARGLSIYAQTVFTNMAVLRSLRDMQNALFGHLIGADLSRLVREAPGHLVSHFTNDFVVIRETLWRCTTGVRDVLTIVGLVASMFHFDWVLSLVVLGAYPVAAIPIVNIGKRLRKASANTQEHLGIITSSLNENLADPRMVKTYQLEEFEKRRQGAQFDRMYRLYLKIIRNRARLDPFLEVLGGLAVGGVIAVGGWRVAQGFTTTGELTAFIAALLMIAPAVRAIGTLNNVLQEGLGAAERTFRVLDEAPKIVDAPDANPLALNEGKIQFRHVNFEYEPGASVLADFTITVSPGTTVALVGPSGAGKSTVLNLIPRFYDPTAGKIMIDGQDIRAVTIASLRASIGLVSQDIVLFNDTIRANIGFGNLSATEEQIIEASKAAAAHEFIENLPNGYDTIVGDRGLKLSGGQRQRIAIARAMLKDPRILLLDEATSALDAESEGRVQQALDRLRAGRTTLVIAHRLSTVRNADRIYVMDEGHVREHGSHDELLARDGLYAKLARLQFRSSEEDTPAEPAAESGLPNPERSVS